MKSMTDMYRVNPTNFATTKNLTHHVTSFNNVFLCVIISDSLLHAHHSIIFEVYLDYYLCK